MDDRELLAFVAAIVFRGCLSATSGLQFEVDHAVGVARAILDSVDRFIKKEGENAKH
jgi:hypothetical protein